jgi:hypothetical protein
VGAEEVIAEFYRRARLKGKGDDHITANVGSVATEVIAQWSTEKYDVPKLERAIASVLRTPSVVLVYGDALSYLRTNWNPLLWVKPVVKPTAKPTPKPAVTPTKTVVLTSPPTTSGSPSPSLVTSAPTSPSPKVAPKPIPVPVVTRHLMNDCVEKSAGTLAFMWNQDKITSMIGIAPDLFFGFCNAASGQYLKDPERFQTILQSQKGKIDLVNSQAAYESVGKADVYVTKKFELTHVKTTEPAALTPENLLSAVDEASGRNMILYLVGASDGSGHAIGIRTTPGGYEFLDVNQGLARLPDRQKFWSFIYYYITDKDQGLNKEYPLFQLAVWA